jgi:hypothetical protein
VVGANDQIIKDHRNITIKKKINDVQEFIPMIVGILKMHNIACVAMTT